MQDRSRAFDQFIKHTSLLVTTVEWSYDGSPWTGIPYIDGTVTCDRKASARWALDLDLPTQTDTTTRAIASYGTRIRVRRGIRLPRIGTEFMAWGVYRIDSVQRTSSRVKVKGLSLEKQIEDTRFLVPRRVGRTFKVLANGQPDREIISHREVVEDLVEEAVPGTEFIWRTDAADDAMNSILEERDRWGLLDGSSGDKVSIAQSIGCEMFYDGSGSFVVQDLPSLSDNVSLRLDEGTPVLVEPTDEGTRASVFNVVVASGSTTDGKKPAGPAFAWDRNPASATYAGPDPRTRPEQAGPFGVVPRFYTSALLKNQAQCQKMADATLRESLGRKESMSFTMFSNPALEPGDIVTRRGKRYLIDSWQATLRGATMSCTTRSSKEDLTDVTIQAETT